jgi:hypothetical protein
MAEKVRPAARLVIAAETGIQQPLDWQESTFAGSRLRGAALVFKRLSGWSVRYLGARLRRTSCIFLQRPANEHPRSNPF